MTGPAYEDDGLSTEDEDEEEEVYVDAATDVEGYTPQFEFSELKLSPLVVGGELPPPSPSTAGPPAGSPLKTVPSVAIGGTTNVMVQEPTPIDTVPPAFLPPLSPVTAGLPPEKEEKLKKEKKTSFSALTKGIRRPTFTPRSSSLGLSLGTSSSSSGPTLSASEPPSGTATPTKGIPPSLASPGGKKRRPKFKRSKASEYNFATNSDILGIVMLEIAGAENLPRLKNSESFTPFPPALTKCVQ